VPGPRLIFLAPRVGGVDNAQILALQLPAVIRRARGGLAFELGYAVETGLRARPGPASRGGAASGIGDLPDQRKPETEPWTVEPWAGVAVRISKHDGGGGGFGEHRCDVATRAAQLR
jgi:hypothetical protein